MSAKITKRMMSSVDDMVSRASSATKRVSEKQAKTVRILQKSGCRDCANHSAMREDGVVGQRAGERGHWPA